MKRLKPISMTQTVALQRESLSPREYINLHRTRPSEIKRATFVPPSIGKPGFGWFEVEYRTPGWYSRNERPSLIG